MRRRFVVTGQEKKGLIGALMVVGALMLMLFCGGCGGSAWKQAALPSPVMVGDSATVMCPERMHQAFPLATFAEVTDYCLEGMELETDRASKSTEAVAEAEGKKAENAGRSCYGAFCGGHYGTMPVMRGGMMYTGGGYNTVGGMLVQTGPSMRPQSAGRNIVPRSAPPSGRRP